MSLLTIIITLVIAGFIMWLINYIPMQPTIKKIVNVIVVIVIIIWLLRAFGLWVYLSNFKI